MANLFFIHTPLQLLVAQQIIRQENLQDNVMLCGYVDDNVHFMDIYDMTIIDRFWSAKVMMPQVARWAVMSRRHLWRDGKWAYKNYRFIKKVIKDYQIDTLYLGDMKNASCQLAAMSFHKKGLKTCFFEEGNGHYIMDGNYGKAGDLKDKIYATLIDTLYYMPLYGVRFGYVKYWKGFTLSDLPMDVRFSIVSFYHEPFDKLVSVKPLISKKLDKVLSEELESLDKNNPVLLMTSPLYEWVTGDEKEKGLYIKTIIDYCKSLGQGAGLHIKFHPRERKDVQERILQELTESGVGYIVLGKQMNLPVEYYLQYVHYDKIVMFISSTSFYNGYLFPKMHFESILRAYYDNCKAAGSPSVKYIEPLMAEIPKE